MAMSFVCKKLSKCPIGTAVELTVDNGASLEKVSGVITETDFETGLELTFSDGHVRDFDYVMIKGFQRIDTGVVEKNEEPSKKSTPPQNVVPVPKTKPAWLHTREPEEIFNVGDGTIRDVLGRMDAWEKKQMSSVYERFTYGVKQNDRNKMGDAAEQARQILFREDDDGYVWSRDAALFCGYLLRRVNIYDHEVFLVGECLEEAAYAAWKNEKYTLAGAYAINALLDGTRLEDTMMVILASSIIKSNDVSALPVFQEHLPDRLTARMNELLDEVFAVKGIQRSVAQDFTMAMNLLGTLYPNQGMKEKTIAWLPQGTSAPAPVEKVYRYGSIHKVLWMNQTGIIMGEDGQEYTFRYQDISETSLRKKVEQAMRSDLDGHVYHVKFQCDQTRAWDIIADMTFVDRARSIMADASRADRFEVAFELCTKAVGSADTQRALTSMVAAAAALYKKGKVEYMETFVKLYEQHSKAYSTKPFDVMDLAQCYHCLKQYPQMMLHADKAMEATDLSLKQKIGLLSSYLRMVYDYYQASGDKSLLPKMQEAIAKAKAEHATELAMDQQGRGMFASNTLHYLVIAACGLEQLETAEKAFQKMVTTHVHYGKMAALMAKTRERLLPRQEEPTAEAVPQVEQPMEAVQTVAQPPVEQEVPHLEAVSAAEEYPEDEEENLEEEILPYVDNEGWEALKLTKKDVVDYALGITGEDRIPSILAYLRAGASLNPQIAPVYNTVALAVNDPMAMPDYDLTALINALANGDADYVTLNDCCMGAAFLRTSFCSPQSYDYSAQSLRNSITIGQQIPALAAAYDTMADFRRGAGHAMDIYADYRNHGVNQLQADLQATIHKAEELYTKFVVNPAREGVKFFRLLETKKIVFNSHLATMLRYIIQQDHDALAGEKKQFVQTYLNGVSQFSKQQISSKAIDDLIDVCWTQAGRGMQMQKANETLQGNRRNNLRSNIAEILKTICQWYALSEQNAGLTWRTEAGVAAYQTLRPQLMEQLQAIENQCHEALEGSVEPQMNTGLFLLAATAKELYKRLEGCWRFEQEKYLYVDFLRSNQVMLGEDFMPDLSGTFCALPDFNILARIRHHVEGEKYTFQQQIDRIYGMDKTCNNYGTAQRIVEYLEAMGGEPVVLPEQADQFLEHTEMQTDMRYRSFRETYAFALNAGQIMKSDAFSYNLEDTIRYWNSCCKAQKNYGFFASLLIHAENQIHTSARQYEDTLYKELDALIASNQTYFTEHPEYANAIREQISNQRFTVAENWMSRIQMDGFSLNVHQPDAIQYQEKFWDEYLDTYKQVSDGSRALSGLLSRRPIRNKDSKGAQGLIDCWLNNGRPSNPQRIEQLLNLLGWKNITVSQYQFSGEPRGEFYEVRKAPGSMVPIHPIAAFGSQLQQTPMYVVCLYGLFDCDRLYEKMRALDAMEGHKVILLDYAMGQLDRRALARKLKKRESSLRYTNMVIDRVLITHLANNYNESLINRILMAVAMPFTYYQPYMPDSSNTMPPEIFIGRREELLKIEAPDGVNLIYGGRQLGKSALFKKAVMDIDGVNQKRAVFVDIVDRNCASAARKVSQELILKGILSDDQMTDDWDTLCWYIKRRLHDTERPIPYLLLLLDEADDFIADCANDNYRPLAALKDVQQSMPGRFKYVLGGLHNIIKFNRQVALGRNSVITHLPSMKITPFQDAEAEELLIEPLSYLGFSLPSKVTVTEILATCNYFPGLIQLYAKKLIESIRMGDYAGYDTKKTPPYIITDEHLRRVMADKEFVEQIYNKFDITLTLDEDQGSYYKPLALLISWLYNAEPSENGYTAKTLLAHARELPVRPLAALDEEKIDALLQEMQDLNILRSVSHNAYLMATKRFRDLLGSDEKIEETLNQMGGVVK